MNERIQELAEQAADGMLSYDAEGEWRLSEREVKKFAELIVQECLSQVDKIRDGLEADSEDQQALGADWAGLAIARHFGVEE